MTTVKALSPLHATQDAPLVRLWTALAPNAVQETGGMPSQSAPPPLNPHCCVACLKLRRSEGVVGTRMSLTPREKAARLVRPPYSAGSVPLSAFPFRNRALKLPHAVPYSAGSVPLSELRSRWSVSTLCHWLYSCGSVPLIELEYTCMWMRLGTADCGAAEVIEIQPGESAVLTRQRAADQGPIQVETIQRGERGELGGQCAAQIRLLPNRRTLARRWYSRGIVPLIAFPQTSKSSRLASVPYCVGSVPLIAFLSRSRCVSRVSVAYSRGSVPLMEAVFRSSTSRSVSADSCGGSLPTSPFEISCRPVTVLPDAEQLTPCQRQQSPTSQLSL
eukprot:6268404-Prymnesium_polylepis.1